MLQSVICKNILQKDVYFRSAYLHFNVANYQQYKAEVGGSLTKVSPLIKAKWATLTPEERQFYESLAQKDRHRYIKVDDYLGVCSNIV